MTNILHEKLLKMKIGNTYKMKSILFIFFVLLFCHVLAQKESDYVIKKTPTDAKNNIYSQVKIRAYDALTKDLLLPIIRIDGVSFSQCDTSFSNFYLSRGKHKLQVGWVGFFYSKKIKLKTKLLEDYEISVYLKPYNKPLH